MALQANARLGENEAHLRVTREQDMQGNLTSLICDGASFHFRTDLFYFYEVEFDDTLDLPAIEKAVAVGIAAGIDICVGTTFSTIGHKISIAGNCSQPLVANECRMVRGFSSVLTQSETVGIAHQAFDIIEDTLDNASFLNKFTSSPITKARMIERFGEYVVPLDKPHEEGNSGDSGLRPIFITIFCVCLAFLFIFGIQSRQRSEKESSSKLRLSFFLARRRKFWDQMEEGNQSPGIISSPEPVQSVTWSVSDLTSEEASIKSAMKMDRIDEEALEEGSEEGLPRSELESHASQDSTTSGSNSGYAAQISFIKDWHENGKGGQWEESDSSKLPHVVWEDAGIPCSYFDDSDPEADTPTRKSTVGALRDALKLPDGGSLLAESTDESYHSAACLLGKLKTSEEEGSRSALIKRSVPILDDSSNEECRSSEAPSDEFCGGFIPEASDSSHLGGLMPTSCGAPSDESDSGARLIVGASCFVGLIPSKIKCRHKGQEAASESFEVSSSINVSSSGPSDESGSSFYPSSDDESLWTPSYVELSGEELFHLGGNLNGHFPSTQERPVHVAEESSDGSILLSQDYVQDELTQTNSVETVELQGEQMEAKTNNENSQDPEMMEQMANNNDGVQNNVPQSGMLEEGTGAYSKIAHSDQQPELEKMEANSAISLNGRHSEMIEANSASLQTDQQPEILGEKTELDHVLSPKDRYVNHDAVEDEEKENAVNGHGPKALNGATSTPVLRSWANRVLVDLKAKEGNPKLLCS